MVKSFLRILILMQFLRDEMPTLESRLIGLLAARMPRSYRQLYYKLLDEQVPPQTLLDNPEEYKECTPLWQALSSKGVLDEARQEVRSWERAGINLVSLGDPLYPYKLARIYEPPLVLFYKGDLKCLHKSKGTLAIVGSRKADLHGCDTAYRIARNVTQAGGCIVSGLALGIDGNAHKGALVVTNAELPTIAILGNGLEMIYPRKHAGLAKKILNQGGLLISQFEPATKPYPANFLNRNRVIAGLSDGVLVVQAPKRSGALVTARYALEEGREVMVVPGDIADPRYEGSNNLIKQGASLVCNTKDVLRITPQVSNHAYAETDNMCTISNSTALSPAQKSIVAVLSEHKSIHYTLLIQKIQDHQTTLQAILELELLGLVQRLPGNYLTLTKR